MSETEAKKTEAKKPEKPVNKEDPFIVPKMIFFVFCASGIGTIIAVDGIDHFLWMIRTHLSEILVLSALVSLFHWKFSKH